MNKAGGPDQISSWFLKTTADEIAPFLQKLSMTSLQSGTIPQDWKKANIHAIFKKGDKSTASNYRPISLTSIICKLMEHILFRHIMVHFQEHNILSNIQHGFRKGHSCDSQLITVVEDLAKNLDNGCQTDVILLDFAKAFDRVAHQRLLLKLKFYGIQGQVYSWIETWLTNRKQTVVVEGSSSESIGVRSGVPQGTVLGPLMFLIYINDISEGIDSHIRLFADDSVVYGIVESPNEAAALQNDLNKLSDWSKMWQMSLNHDKCSVLKIGRTKTPITFQYTIDGVALKTVEHHPYLGVELSKNLDWGHHIHNITGKANQSLGFIRRNLGSCPQNVKEQAYMTLVRPRLEYASSVWDPHLKKHHHDLEKIQRRAARFVTGCYDYQPGTVTNLLQELKWPTLEERRMMTRLTTFYKITSGELAVEIPAYIQRPTRVTRSLHPKRFINMGSSSNTYKNTFFTRTVKEWNLLPNEILEKDSVNTFKSALEAYFVK